MKQTTKYVISVGENELKKNLYGSYVQLLTDSLTDDFEYFESDVMRLNDVIQSIEKHGFAPVFRDGYTMMLLSPKDFQDVEKFFHEHDNDGSELVIEIRGENAIRETVKHEDLSY